MQCSPCCVLVKPLRKIIYPLDFNTEESEELPGENFFKLTILNWLLGFVRHSIYLWIWIHTSEITIYAVFKNVAYNIL